MAKKELLAECYRNRISDLYRKIGFPADIKDKYVNLLLSADSQDTPSSPNEFLELFLDKTNTRSKVDRLFGDCNEVHVYKSFWDGKHLITNEHTSAVECTGRSVHYFYNHTYCLNNNKFIATDTFFGCPKPYKKMEIISHGKAYLESNFSALVGSNTTKDSLLRKILETVKESKNPYLSGSWIYSETSMKYVLENTELLSELIQGYDDAVIGIINDLLKVHNSITSQSGWERNFNSYRPYKPNNYMDNAYNNISEGFPSTPDIQRGRVIANVHYTYQELYFRFWYKTYQQHSMTLAHKAMTKLKQELITRKE